MICLHETWEMDTAVEADGLCPICLHETVLKLRTERTYYRDMWLAQRVENENFRKQLGLVPVSDEAERALTPRSTTPTDDRSKG
jgi:hypothetical protein